MPRNFNDDVRATLNQSVTKKDSTFELKYFKIHGLGWCSRLILATSGAKWEATLPQDWAKREKDETIFGVLPVLYETTSSGEKFEIPETDAIEHYLSKKFDLYGQGDVYDEIKIRALACSNQGMIIYYLLRVCVVKDPEYKATMQNRFITEALPNFVATHERLLQANGQNGHYIGNKLSLADLKLSMVTRITLFLTGDNLISQEKTPGIWAVFQHVNAIPSFVEWRTTDAYKELEAGNLESLGF